jgi:hypothetical protein
MTIGQRIAAMLAEVDLVEMDDTARRRHILRTQAASLLADIPGLHATGVDMLEGEFETYATGWSPSLHRIAMRTMRTIARPEALDATIRWFADAATTLWMRSVHASALGMDRAPLATGANIMHLHVDASLAEINGGDVVRWAAKAVKASHAPVAARTTGLGGLTCAGGECHVQERDTFREAAWRVSIDVDGDDVDFDGTDVTFFGPDIPDSVVSALPGRRIDDLLRTGTCLDARIVEEVDTTKIDNGCFYTLTLRQQTVPLASLAS